MNVAGLRHWLSQPGLRRRPFQTVVRALFWKLLRVFGCELVAFRIRRTCSIVVPVTHGRGLPGVLFIVREAYEEHVGAAVEEFVSAGMQVLDIGANVGYWTLTMGELVGDSGHVFAFEPSRQSSANLRRGLVASGLDRRVTLFECALGERVELRDLYEPEDSGLSSLGRVSVSDAMSEVEVRTLDEVWESLGRPQVGFVKIDVEGAEVLVLKGAAAFFRSCKPVVVCEVNDSRLRALGSSAVELVSLFRSAGYEAQRLCWGTRRREPLGDLAAYDDVLFTPVDRL